MLLQIRIGPGKKKLTDSIVKVSRLCGIPAQKIHRVPHISLYGGFQAGFDQVKKVKDIMVSLGNRYSCLQYLIDGFSWIDGKDGKVVYFNIKVSDEFRRFRQELADRLLKIVPRTKSYDKDDAFLFHSTLAYRLDSREFERIWSYVSGEGASSDKFDSLLTDPEDYNMRYFYLPLYALRMTFLDDQSRINCEYDFLKKRLILRGEASDIPQWQETLRIFRQARGMENNPEVTPRVGPFVASDLHLGHANIIEYCARPFVPSDVEEMNEVLTNNWNNTVGNNVVYYLGSLSMGKGPDQEASWQSKLRGNIKFIKWAEDSSIGHSSEYEVLEYKRHKFLLVYDPEKLPFSWHHWVIHGFKHNNDMKNYPFINGDKKTINVSPEIVNYQPVSLDYLISLNLDSIKRMDTIDSVPVRRTPQSCKY